MHCILWFFLYELCSMPCILRIEFYELYSMHCIICRVLYALYYIHYVLCIVLYALYSKHCYLCIAFYAVYPMHCILCILLSAKYTIHAILCIEWYALNYMQYIPCIADLLTKAEQILFIFLGRVIVADLELCSAPGWLANLCWGLISSLSRLHRCRRDRLRRCGFWIRWRHRWTWVVDLVFLGSSSCTNLMFISVSLWLPSTLTTMCSCGLTSITTPVLSHLDIVLNGSGWPLESRLADFGVSCRFWLASRCQPP